MARCLARVAERVATVTALVTVGFSFDDELEYLHRNPVRKGRGIRGWGLGIRGPGLAVSFRLASRRY
jgi:hypothetical protein